MPKSYLRTSSLFFGTPLAMLPAKRDEILAFWNLKLSGAPIDLTPFLQRDEELAQVDVMTPANSGAGVAVLPLYGIIAQRMGIMEAMSGGTSTDSFAQAMRELVADSSVKAIVVDVHSPGGTTYGMTELADVIYGLRGQKPMVAQVNSLMASAAFWIGSQFDEIAVTPGGELGHIGVSSLHIDKSKALEDAGLKAYLVTAGKYKHEQSMGSDLIPPTDEALAAMQASVDEAYGRFVSAVARGRRVTSDQVINGFGEGRVVSATDAVKLGMADRIATLEQTVTRLMRGGGKRSFARVSQIVDSEPPIVGKLQIREVEVDAPDDPQEEPELEGVDTQPGDSDEDTETEQEGEEHEPEEKEDDKVAVEAKASFALQRWEHERAEASKAGLI